MDLNYDTAKAIVEAAHAAWNAGSVEGMLEKYVDDMVYATNTGPDGSLLMIRGKEDFRARFSQSWQSLTRGLQCKVSDLMATQPEFGSRPSCGTGRRDRK